MSHDSRKAVANGLKHVLTLTVAFGMLFPFAPTYARAEAAPGSPIARQKEILESLGSQFDASSFDVDALALDLAFEDAQTIADHVRRNIGYEAYVGLLRGPQGTLVAKAGNALDQAVLLAQVLIDAGYEARVGLGRLSEPDALALVMSMFEREPAPEPTGQPDAAAFERFARSTGASVTEIERAAQTWDEVSLTGSEAYLAAAGAREIVVESLTAAGMPLGGDVTAGLVAEARDYAWVEYRLGASDPWSAAHPAWPTADEAPTVEATEHLYGEVPRELLHRLRIEVMLERKQGDEFVTEAIMTPWERPVANLLGVTLTVGNTVMGEGADAPLGELGTALAEVPFFVPTLNGAVAPGALAFDTMGNVVDPSAAGSAAAGVFQTGARKMNQAIGALGAMGGGDADEEPFALTAQWVDYVLVAPDGEETRHRRYLFDRRTPEARVDGGTDLQDQSVLLNGILMTQSVMVAAGALSAEFVASELTEQALAYLDAMETLAASTATGAGLSDVMLATLGDLRPRDQLALISAFDLLGTGGGGIAYRAEPTVVSLYNTLTPGPEPSAGMGVDIVANARRFLVRNGDAVVVDAESAILAGTWETAVERGYMQRQGAEVQGAYAAFAGATGTTVIAPFDGDALAGSNVDPAALPALRADLAAGYALVLPSGPAPEGAQLGWWRVDPLTGETLGMGLAGRGTATVEYKISLGISGALAGVLAIPGAIICATRESGAELAICLCDVAVNGAVGFAMGAGLGVVLAGAMAVNAATIISFLAFDIAAGAAGAVPGFIPGACSSIRDAVALGSHRASALTASCTPA